MSVTIYKKAGEPFDLIAAEGFMLAAFHSTAPIDISGRTIGQYHFLTTADNRIRQIGARKPGYTSAGAKVLEMIPPAFLRFAGTFHPRTDQTIDLVLFDSYYDVGKPQTFIEPATSRYSRICVAFYDLSPADLMIITPAQASRILSKDFIGNYILDSLK